MELTDVLLKNYLPYAKGVIVGRAIPSIDGLKPVQRRILYTMYTMGLLNGNKTKSSNIVGQSMKRHPHGDTAIYESMVRLSTGHGALNIPYVESKGNFGKIFSKDMAYAASRYTEAKLAKICKEVFEGIEENAVEFISTFDNTDTEPTLLPVKFPSILVNPSNGIAVGTSSSIPPFDLGCVCEATIKILEGSIKNVSELMEVLGVPEFSTGGTIYATKEDLNKLGETGRATFGISGTVEVYNNKIVITEIPYKTYSETIVGEIIEKVKSGELKEVSDVHDDTGIDGFGITVEIKRGYDSNKVLNKLLRMTSLYMQISFITRVIIGDRCEELSLLELLNRWIEFRVSTIKRMYKFRLDKKQNQEHLLSAWEKVKDNIFDVIDTISKNSENEAIQNLIDSYKLDDSQSEYFLDMKIKNITTDNMTKKLKALEDIRNDIKEYKGILEDKNKIINIIIGELKEIKNNYGVERKTKQSQPLPDEIFNSKLVDEKQMDETEVIVIMTKNYMIKRIHSKKDMESLVLGDDKITNVWETKNGDSLLVFTNDGTVHKISVGNIDASRGSFKDNIVNILNLSDKNNIAHIDMGGDYSKYITFIYKNGRGVRVPYDRVSGKRAKYINVYEHEEPGKLVKVFSDEFLLLTRKRKASYCNLKPLNKLGGKVSFRAARVGSDDYAVAVQPIDKIPNVHLVDLDRYKRDYCVKIGEDKLW